MLSSPWMPFQTAYSRLLKVARPWLSRPAGGTTPWQPTRLVVDVAVAVGDHEVAAAGAVRVRRAAEAGAPGVAADPRRWMSEYPTTSTAVPAADVTRHMPEDTATVAVEILSRPVNPQISGPVVAR